MVKVMTPPRSLRLRRRISTPSVPESGAVASQSSPAASRPQAWATSQTSPALGAAAAQEAAPKRASRRSTTRRAVAAPHGRAGIEAVLRRVDVHQAEVDHADDLFPVGVVEHVGGDPPRRGPAVAHLRHQPVEQDGEIPLVELGLRRRPPGHPSGAARAASGTWPPPASGPGRGPWDCGRRGPGRSSARRSGPPPPAPARRGAPAAAGRRAGGRRSP